jgi:membrane protein
MDILELVVGAPERPWWKKRAISLGYVVAGICILAVLLFLAVRVHVIVALVGLGLAALTNLAFFYRIAIEYHHRQLRIFWPGATLAVFVWLAMSSGFGVYATTLGTYAKYYGSLAAVTVLLLWLWLTALALLAGAELNSQLETRELNKRKAAGVESIPQSSESAST